MKVIGFYHEYDNYGCFSNWYKAAFVNGREHFTSVEQYMMYQKALMFREYDLADKILQTDDPAIIKNLGRSYIADFDAELWDKLSYNIVKRGIRAKFEQNPDILEILLSTDDAILAEAAPNDKKWGVGISVNDERINNPQNWTGKNYLGRILMEIRYELKILRISNKLGFMNALEIDFPSWHEKAGELRSNPYYYKAISTYSDTLRTKHEKDCFLYQATLSEWEDALLTNMGGGLPVIGFFELKQELYDISRMI